MLLPFLPRTMATTFSFDVVSDFDRQELLNAVDQTRREVATRYDLKTSGTEITLEDTALTISTASDMTLRAVNDILNQKAIKRNLSAKVFDVQTAETAAGQRVRQQVKLRRGMSQEQAKILSKRVRNSGLKVQVQIQAEVLRVSSRSKDDLQSVKRLLEGLEIDYPLQFRNYR